MKNQYFGDINDYVKYGLLRVFSATHRVAVCWMLTPPRSFSLLNTSSSFVRGGSSRSDSTSRRWTSWAIRSLWRKT